MREREKGRGRDTGWLFGFYDISTLGRESWWGEMRRERRWEREDALIIQNKSHPKKLVCFCCITAKYMQKSDYKI